MKTSLTLAQKAILEAIPEEFDLIDDVCFIENKSDVVRYVCEKANLDSEDVPNVIKTINQRGREEKHYTYFAVDGYEVDSDDESSHYKLLNTGYTCGGKPIYLSLYRFGSDWKGAYVVTLAEFIEMSNKYYSQQVMKSDNSKYMSEREETPFEQKINKSKKAVVTQESLEIAPKNKEWQEVTNYIRLMCNSPSWVFDTVDKLVSYLYALELRILGRVRKSYETGIESDSFRLSADKSNIYFNLGITNKFGKSIYAIATTDYDSNTDTYKFTNVHVVRCRDMFLEYNFSNTDANFKPVFTSFFDADSGETPIFTSCLSDVDMENPNSITHCMIDNVSRLPKYIQNMSEDERVDLYFKKIQLSFERHAVDSFYFKPFYCIKNDAIEYIIPIYENDDVSGKIEYGFILGKSPRGFWGIYTVLTPEQCKNNIQVVQPFSNVNI